jgi:hypothetical protein
LINVFQTFLPDLEFLKITGNPIERDEQIEALTGAGLRVITAAGVQGGDDDVSPIEDEIDEEAEEEDEGRREELGNAVSWTPIARSAPSRVSSDSRTGCVAPFMDYFVQTSRSNIQALISCYTEDAVFSVTFGKAGSDLRPLFEYNRNLMFERSTKDPVVGNANIIGVLRKIFPSGCAMQVAERVVNVVSGLFFGVAMYGSVAIQQDNFGFMRTFVVIGDEGRLLISNDSLAIRYLSNARN